MFTSAEPARAPDRPGWSRSSHLPSGPFVSPCNRTPDLDQTPVRMHLYLEAQASSIRTVTSWSLGVSYDSRAAVTAADGLSLVRPEIRSRPLSAHRQMSNPGDEVVEGCGPVGLGRSRRLVGPPPAPRASRLLPLPSSNGTAGAAFFLSGAPGGR